VSAQPVSKALQQGLGRPGVGDLDGLAVENESDSGSGGHLKTITSLPWVRH
jgi:hypothetical protein